MEKVSKNPFEKFVERAEEIRKRPISKEAILEINELSIEVEKEESDEKQPSDDRKIASKPLDAPL